MISHSNCVSLWFSCHHFHSLFSVLFILSVENLPFHGFHSPVGCRYAVPSDCLHWRPDCISEFFAYRFFFHFFRIFYSPWVLETFGCLSVIECVLTMWAAEWLTDCTRHWLCLNKTVLSHSVLMMDSQHTGGVVFFLRNYCWCEIYWCRWGLVSCIMLVTGRHLTIGNSCFVTAATMCVFGWLYSSKNNASQRLWYTSEGLIQTVLLSTSTWHSVSFQSQKWQLIDMS